MFLRVRRLATGGVFESSMGAVISAMQGPNGPLGVQPLASLSLEWSHNSSFAVAMSAHSMRWVTSHLLRRFVPKRQCALLLIILAGCPYPASSAASLHLLGGAELAAVGPTGLGILPGYNTLSTPKI